MLTNCSFFQLDHDRPLDACDDAFLNVARYDEAPLLFNTGLWPTNELRQHALSDHARRTPTFIPDPTYSLEFQVGVFLDLNAIDASCCFFVFPGDREGRIRNR